MKTFGTILTFTLLIYIQHVCAAQLRDRNKKPYRMVCYYGSWAGNRHSHGYLSPEELDTGACTHLIYAYAALHENKIEPRDAFLDLEDNWGKGFYKKFNALRKKNSQLTTIVSIGEWQDGMKSENLKYSMMVTDQGKRKIFIESVVEFLKKYNFDGLDFVWEYPTVNSKPSDKTNYVLLLKELKAAFEPHGFLLTVGVGASKSIVEVAYDILEISKYADIINVMTYDFHGSWEQKTGHNSPLYARPDETGYDRFQNIDYAIRLWTDKGADKKKITLGIPMFGRCYSLEDKTNTGYAAPAPNAGRPGPYTQKPGMLGYNELCSMFKTEPWKRVWNKYHYAPYAFYDNQWCSYDDVESVTKKVEYIKGMGLSGAMVWSLDTDDFQGLCSQKKFPLLYAITDALKDTSTKPQIPTTPEREDLPDTTEPSITHPSTMNPWATLCKQEGLIKMPNDCSKYIQCIKEAKGFKPVERVCPPATVFNEKYSRCDFPDNVPGCM